MNVLTRRTAKAALNRLPVVVGLFFVLALLAACSALRVPQTPVAIGDPSPGYVRITAVPPQASFPVTVWFRDPKFGGLSTVSFDFAVNEPILIVFPSTPTTPGNVALQVNDNPCEGTWSVTSMTETDLLLQFDEDSCRVDVVGSHVFGEVHTDPQTEANVAPVE